MFKGLHTIFEMVRWCSRSSKGSFGNEWIPDDSIDVKECSMDATGFLLDSLCLSVDLKMFPKKFT